MKLLAVLSLLAFGLVADACPPSQVGRLYGPRQRTTVSRSASYTAGSCGSTAQAGGSVTYAPQADIGYAPSYDLAPAYDVTPVYTPGYISTYRSTYISRGLFHRYRRPVFNRGIGLRSLPLRALPFRRR